MRCLTLLLALLQVRYSTDYHLLDVLTNFSDFTCSFLGCNGGIFMSNVTISPYYLVRFVML